MSFTIPPTLGEVYFVTVNVGAIQRAKQRRNILVQGVAPNEVLTNQ